VGSACLFTIKKRHVECHDSTPRASKPCQEFDEEKPGASGKLLEVGDRGISPFTVPGFVLTNPELRTTFLRLRERNASTNVTDVDGRQLRPEAEDGGRKKYPFVLMLEPLFRCNLACAGCGKIQYPAHI